MLPSLLLLRKNLEAVIAAKAAQGHEVTGLQVELSRLPDTYDALAAFGEKLPHLPLRSDWPYVEPNDLDSIWAECDPDRPRGAIRVPAVADVAGRIRAAFEGAVAGCMLGKPLEVNPTLDDIRAAAEPIGEWPIRDYVTPALMERMPRRHNSWPTTTRGNIHFVTPDDDINYSILGMLMIEQYGAEWTRKQLADLWLHNLPVLATYGSERIFLLRAGMATMLPGNLWGKSEWSFEDWAGTWNPREEGCGAAIRVDAYGYACAGNPELAATLAWRDAAMTHSRTGIYGSMFVAAAIAAAFVARDPMEIFTTALKFVPRRSRFHAIVSDCLGMVMEAENWMDGYRAINAKYGEYGHCLVYQESGQLINTARFAGSVEDAICMQVMQGCDTDCYGEIIGSIMGAYFGPGYLHARWLVPFQDRLYTDLGGFHEQSLSAVTDRMARLHEVLRDGAGKVGR